MAAGFKEWMLKEEKGHRVPTGEILRHIKIPLPSVRQQKTFSCGAAALRAICEFYKVGPRDEDEFIKLLDTNYKDGTEPDALVRGAKCFGLNVVKKEGMTIGQLLSYIDKQWPVICNIQAWGSKKYYKKLESGHYVVAIGYDDKHIYFEDPSLEGDRGKLTYEDFCKRWHDQETSGEKTHHLGIVCWKNSPDTDPHYLVRATKIQ